MGPASGWFGRAQRLVEREGRDCVEQGWLLVPAVFQREAAGDYAGAHEVAAQAVEIAERFGDADLAAIALHAQGVMRIKQGSIVEGLQLLTRRWSGSRLICLAGAQAWLLRSDCRLREASRYAAPRSGTDALTRWCDGQLQMVLSRAAVCPPGGPKQLHGEWRDASSRRSWPGALRGGDEPGRHGQALISRRAASPPGRFRGCRIGISRRERPAGSRSPGCAPVCSGDVEAAPQ
jgi:hypothetical protein